MNTNYRESGDVSSQCDALCRAYRFGQDSAEQHTCTLESFEAVAPVWWLDVQIVSDWSSDLTLNAEAIRGVADYLKERSIRVGISSTLYQWEAVAGDASHNMPVWDASATDAEDAAAYCLQGKDFGGGPTEQIAYVAEGFEVVLACGGFIPTPAE